MWFGGFKACPQSIMLAGDVSSQMEAVEAATQRASVLHPHTCVRGKSLK